jgi:hypothetical protein
MTQNHSYAIYQQQYSDFNGTTARIHADNFINQTYENMKSLIMSRILTNTLYARIGWNVPGSIAYTGYYGYSGFKLSQPHWSPRRLSSAVDPKPFKRATNLPLPDPLKALDKYKVELLGLDPARPDDYALGIILEEDTPLAIDPDTNFPVERYSAYVKADVLADLVAKFKTGAADPVKAGYRKYLDKWRAEGINLGV